VNFERILPVDADKPNRMMRKKRNLMLWATRLCQQRRPRNSPHRSVSCLSFFLFRLIANVIVVRKKKKDRMARRKRGEVSKILLNA
jgi:hypothetical protein